MNAYVEAILTKYLPQIINGDAVAVPDDPEEMNWRLFFAHSQDMQGFRADVFTGGLNEGKHPRDSSFVGLRPRWGKDSVSLMRDLASLWEDSVTRAALMKNSSLMRSEGQKPEDVRPGISLLRNSGISGALVFADTLETFHGEWVARKTNAMIRAYIQNAHLLAPQGYSFRAYLQSLLPAGEFPPANVEQAEKIWIARIQQDFYNVGPALSRYLICDWLFWLWREERIEWFTAYKPDSVHTRIVAEGRLPKQAEADFVGYCKTLLIPEGFGILSGKPCPPRILNECIWLRENRSSH